MESLQRETVTDGPSDDRIPCNEIWILSSTEDGESSERRAAFGVEIDEARDDIGGGVKTAGEEKSVDLLPFDDILVP